VRDIVRYWVIASRTITEYVALARQPGLFPLCLGGELVEPLQRLVVAT